MLIYTGNGQLTTTAAAIGNNPVPNSLKSDQIMQGNNYDLFAAHIICEHREIWRISRAGSFKANHLVGTASGSVVLLHSVHARARPHC